MMGFEYLVQVIIAGICGLLIGYERKNRMKEAGIRTHFVVAIGASLMMLVSKYGFYDELGQTGIALDPSRIAAQVVSGVGFLGAGMIFMQCHTIKGLTTAAGIWVTAGIGMAIGSGLYVLGIGVTALILVAQIVLHRRSSWLTTPKSEHWVIRIMDEADSLANMQKMLKAHGIIILHLHTEKLRETAEILLDLAIKLPADAQFEHMLALIHNAPYVNAMEVQ